jgi:VIT1/CCC1 family predicted Fe2+/Mn2+ transporter
MERMLERERERLLDPVDRISEILFGLIMAVTIVGALSVATARQSDVRTVLIAALGCNLAWGLVDAVMYLVRTVTERTRNQVLRKRVMDADAATARRLIASALPEPLARVVGPEEIEGIRRRLSASSPPTPSILVRDDYLAALGIFLLVVIATLPVVVPFMLTTDVALAMKWSRAVTLVMLFLCGYALGRHSGYRRPVAGGVLMALLGAALIAAVMALGG